MSIFGSWVVTLAFFFGVFLVGKGLQFKERRDKLTKRAEKAIEQSSARPWERERPADMPSGVSRRREGTSYCLNCKEFLAYCGKPFTAKIACDQCGAVNVFEDSQQPSSFALPVRN